MGTSSDSLQPRLLDAELCETDHRAVGGAGRVMSSPWRLRLLITLVILIGLVGFVIAAVTAAGDPLPAWWRISLVCVLLPLSQLAVLRMRLRGQQVGFVWGEGALLLGLMLLPAHWVALLTACCMTVLGAVQGKGVVKTLYNAAAATIGTAAAGGLATVVYGAGPLIGLSWRLVIALTVAGLVFTTVAAVSASAAIALSQAEAFFPTLRVGVGLELLTGLGNVGAALLVVALAEFDPWLLATVPMVVFALQIMFHSRLRAQQERETWTRLEHTTRAFTQLDPAAVATGAIKGVIELFQADRVEVLFCLPDGSTAQYRGERAGVGDEAEQFSDGGSKVVVPLGQPEEGLGTLSLHFSGQVSLNRREHHALATLATALAVALANAERYEETRDFAEAKARQLVTDPITGLGNRAKLTEAGTERLAGVAARGVDEALLLIDLDHFKEVNDTLGHDTGDRLLVEVARRLTAVAAEGDLVVRLGTHEFALLAPAGSSEALADLCTSVIATLDQPLVLDGLHISAPASIGIARCPADARSIRDLLRLADAALVRAKTATARYAQYDAHLDQPHADRLLIVEESRSGIDNGEFVLHYQPQVDLDTREIRGVEALVRWQHPTRGLLSPGAFLPAVEQSALVHEFTHRVLDLAMSDCVAWLAQDQRRTLAVNLSARNLLNLSLPDEVSQLLTDHRMPARQLVLEVTETAMMSDLDTVDTVLDRLRDIGLQLSLDDFGTGYSSLSVLSRIAVDEVKIDLAFVSRMLTSPRDDVVVRGTLSLAHGLGLGVVAEGVEIAAQYERLMALGCETAQGYYFSGPVPIEQLKALPRQLPSVFAPPSPRSPMPSHLPAMAVGRLIRPVP